jgi:hypothetical protein
VWSWSLSGGDHRWFKRITRKNRPVTREIIIIIIICWHNSHQNNYRYSTGNTKIISHSKLQMKTHKYNNSKSHLECLLK